MNPVYVRMLGYVIGPMLAIAFGFLAGFIDGIEYDAATEIATINIREAAMGIAAVLAGAFTAIGAVFMKWGKK